jgi:hypothetical protein
LYTSSFESSVGVATRFVLRYKRSVFNARVEWPLAVTPLANLHPFLVCAL